MHDRGVKFMLSHSDTSSTLYSDSIFRVLIVKAPRSVNSKADARGPVDELLITNYVGE